MYIYIYIHVIETLAYIHHGHVHIYIYIICHRQEQGRKGRRKEVQSDDRKVARPNPVRLGHFVFGK